MTELMQAYLIWLACSLLFVAIGISCFFSAEKGKVAGFWASINPLDAEQLTDVAAFNKAVGKLFIAFGIGFALLGLLILYGGLAGAVFTTLGSFAMVIALVVTYVLKIEPKYRKK